MSDGIDDLIIGAPKFVLTGATGVGKGRSYIIFGQKGSWNTPFDLSTLNGTNGFTLFSSRYPVDVVGASVSGAGDINDDGIDDLVVGAPAQVNSINYPRDTPGDIYVIFGRKVSQNPNNQLTQPTKALLFA